MILAYMTFYIETLTRNRSSEKVLITLVSGTCKGAGESVQMHSLASTFASHTHIIDAVEGVYQILDRSAYLIAAESHIRND